MHTVRRVATFSLTRAARKAPPPDAQIGKVLDELERLGLASNTIVVLFCDHGYSLGEADHWCKDTNFELDTHVPLHRLRWRKIF